MRGTLSDLGAGALGEGGEGQPRWRERCQAGSRAQQACPGLEPALLPDTWVKPSSQDSGASETLVFALTLQLGAHGHLQRPLPWLRPAGD